MCLKPNCSPVAFNLFQLFDHVAEVMIPVAYTYYFMFVCMLCTGSVIFHKRLMIMFFNAFLIIIIIIILFL